ncbi:hypothetical protein EVAR_23084_1 [Eumeta japonica]|uniref:Uncharacterized protein n=1 Tax=Eumeta variegata TaxID=151549 RepID=A0A4C1VKX5_EUMVA|nr:hypothetical protein EVAR_23084_1 [Eumeta japonica]
MRSQVHSASVGSITIFINKPGPIAYSLPGEFRRPFPALSNAHPRIKQAPSCQILVAPRLSNSSPAFDRDPPSPAGEALRR